MTSNEAKLGTLTLLIVFTIIASILAYNDKGCWPVFFFTPYVFAAGLLILGRKKGENDTHDR